MAKYENILLGGFRGKVGNMVGTYWKGKFVVRRAPGPRKTAPTESQVKQQARFKMLVQFLKPLKGLFDQTLVKSAKNMSCLNKAVSLNKEIIVGEYPDFSINFEGVILSKNVKPQTDEVMLSCAHTGFMRFSFKHVEEPDSNHKMSELTFVAVYCAGLKQWIYKLSPKMDSNGNFDLDLTVFQGYVVHTYIGLNPGYSMPHSSFMGVLEIL